MIARAVARNGPAAERITRSLAFTIGAGGTILGLFGIPEILTQSADFDTVWNVVAVVAVFGSSVALAATARRAPLPVVRRIAVVLAAGYLVVVVSGPFAVPYDSVDSGAAWPYRLLAIGVLATVLVWPLPATVGYLVLAAAAAAVLNGQARGESSTVAFLLDFADGITTAALFAWFATRAMTAGAVLDREADAAERDAEAAAARAAQEHERIRFAGLTHDAVLSTLLDASRSTDPARLAEQAAGTVAQLDGYRTEVPGSDDADADAVAAQFRAEVEALSPAIRFELRRDAGSGTLRVPVDAVRSLAAALVEAIRNSVRHAGPCRRTVTAIFGSHGVEVLVRDDGAGFDPAAVPPNRLGVAMSIHGRMRDLAGGAAQVESRPGAGTTVRLSWRPAPAPPATDQDLTTLIGLHSRAALALLAILQGGIVLSLFKNGSHAGLDLPIVLGYLAIALAAAATVLTPGEPIPLRVAVPVVIAGLGATWLIQQHTEPNVGATETMWSAIAMSLVLSVVVLRGRPLFACGSAVAVCVVATIGVGVDKVAAAGVVVVFSTVVAVSVFVAIMRPTLRSLHELREAAILRSVTQARLAAQRKERDRQLERLDTRARPTLARIASGARLDAAAREESRLLEAELRDTVRAPELCAPQVVAAARAARQRGVDVLLLDDGGFANVTAPVRDIVLSTAAAELETAEAGSVTVRVLPPGRRFLATVLAAGTAVDRRIEIDRLGTVRVAADRHRTA